MKDPSAAKFPYLPPKISDVLKKATLQLKEGGSANAADHLKKFANVGFYFSASWCGPCRAFTPQLIEFYKAQKAKDPNSLEIVFVSADRDEGSFEGYWGKMPWPALEFDAEERDAADALNAIAKVEGIPTFVLADLAKDKLTVKEGRGMVSSCPADFPWGPKPIMPYEAGLAAINDVRTFLLFDDSLIAEFTAAAESKFNPDAEDAPQFIVADPSHPMTDRIRGFLHLDKSTKVACVDIQAQGKFVPEGEVAGPALGAWVESVYSGAAAVQSLKP